MSPVAKAVKKMTENTETAAFMRCRRCGFELHLPKWAVDEIEKGYPGDD